MKAIYHAFLVFLATVLQVVVVEAQEWRGGNGRNGGGNGGPPGGNGGPPGVNGVSTAGSTSGSRGLSGGAIAGITIGAIAGAIILAALIRRYRATKMSGRRSALQDDTLYANEIAKGSDLEKNPKGYQNPPAYPTSAQYKQTDWRRDLGPIPSTSYMGPASSPPQYSRAQPSSMPHPPVQPPPAYGQ